MFQLFLQSELSHIHFHIGLWLIIRKVSKRVTTLWLETLQSKFIWKSYNHIKFRTFLLLGEHDCSLAHMVVPWSNLSSFSLGIWLFPREMPKFLGNDMFRIFLQLEPSHAHFYIGLRPIIGKVFRSVTTLWPKPLELKFIWRSYDHTKFWTHLFPKEHGYSLKQLRTPFPQGHGCFLGPTCA
jgi:hypothetical protein